VRRAFVALIFLGVFAPAAAVVAADDAKTATAIFAGGCFWCMEGPFDAVEGVVSTTSGYTGGHVAKPTYEAVSSGTTGHAEAVEITYDPAVVSYEKLLDVFWHNVDPLDAGGQFCDRGSQYRSAIFVADAKERRLAEASKRALEKSGRFQQPIATEIAEAAAFTPAEAYHQDYYRRNPVRYGFYRRSCGRDARLEERWGAASH
jgi:peptide-methionine (S)-S-oxide reductase